MFVRIRKNKGSLRRSVLICHNIRINDKIRQIIVKTIGHSANDEELQDMQLAAMCWISQNKDEWFKGEYVTSRQRIMKHNPSLFNLREEARINVGAHDIFGVLYKHLGFKTLLSPMHQETLKHVLFARLLEPMSKRKISSVSEKQMGVELPLDRIYRMMDALIKEEDDVQQMIFNATNEAVGGKVSLLLFDVTTLWFETVEEDELRAYGYSKDCKFNTTQVVLALATTKEGLPVGYKLFPGNTAESKTLISSIEQWRTYLPIENVTVVGDRAMMSDANLEQLELAGYHYIVACPLRKLSRDKKALILDKDSYVENGSDEAGEKHRIIELDKSRKILVSHSQKRAEKDRKDRERLISKLEKKLGASKNVKRLVNNQGYLKFTDIAGVATANIDQEKVNEDAAWDGIHGVITNKPNVDTFLYAEYRRLWVIEESFRINKHTLQMRPIYHFTPRRIKAHILLCYMVFALIRYVQFKLNKLNYSLSAERIIDAVRSVQASIFVDITNDTRYKMLSKLDEDAQLIYEAFSIERGITVACLEESL
jgi:transposase